jgi:hypothetical protein
MKPPFAAVLLHFLKLFDHFQMTFPSPNTPRDRTVEASAKEKPLSCRGIREFRLPTKKWSAHRT